MSTFNVGILLPVGRILLLGAFAYILVRNLRDDEELSESIEALVVGFLALIFFREGAALLSKVSGEMVSYLEAAGGGASVMGQLTASLETAHKDTRTSQNTLTYINTLKGGVWGTLIVISQFIFMCVEGLLIAAQKVLWNLLLTLTPIAAGLYPVFPSMLKSLSLYAIELSLWMPVLYLINHAAGTAISSPEVAQAPFGLGVVITELLVIVLLLYVPSVTHRFMSGAFNHLLGAGSPAVAIARKSSAFAGGSLVKGLSKLRGAL
jgi:hypothetical protein